MLSIASHAVRVCSVGRLPYGRGSIERRYVGTAPELWINLQSSYELDKAAAAASGVSPFSLSGYMPVSLMKMAAKAAPATGPKTGIQP